MKILKLFLSMSVSGGLLILVFLLCGRLLRDKLSRQWQYYIWLLVIARLLLPFGTKASLLGEIYASVDAYAARAAAMLQQDFASDTNVPEKLEADIEATGQTGQHMADPDTQLTAPEVEAGRQAKEQTAYTDNQETAQDTDTIDPAVHNGQKSDSPTDSHSTEDETANLFPAISQPLGGMVLLFLSHLPHIWLTAALLLLMRRITAYQGFLRCTKAGALPVCDTALLDRLSETAESIGIKKPVELCVHPLVSSPMLIGFFRPCIVLPDAALSETNFRCIALHELTHYKRRDLFYKWLVQITVCLHWFNPLVYAMSRKIADACEFSCDEAVLAKIGTDSAPAYGKTLLDAMAVSGTYRKQSGALTLSENKQLLKERLGAIMSFKKKSTAVRVITGLLTLCIAAGTALIGVYPAFAAAKPATGKSGKASSSDSGKSKNASASDSSKKSAAAANAERYYKAGSLPLFQAAFSCLSAAEQASWLKRIYADDDIVFFSVALQVLDEDSPLISKYAKKAYKDDEIAFFSVLADYMDKKTLKSWLERALSDENIAFQSVLLDKLDQDDEKDALEEKWAKQQMAEYKKFGITMKGKNYYYKGKLIRMFLDRRTTINAYTLNINPKGTVDIKVVRNKKDAIKKVSYMTEEEVKEILGTEATYRDLDDLEDLDDLDSLDDLDNLDDLDDLDDLDNLDDLDDLDNLDNWDDLNAFDDLDNWPDDRKITIPVNISKIKDGAFVWLGSYKLAADDLICYDVSAKTGARLDIGFAKPGQANPTTMYHMISNRRTDGALKIKSGAMKWGNTVTPGTYRLFVHTKGGNVKKVTGTVTIIKGGAKA